MMNGWYDSNSFHFNKKIKDNFQIIQSEALQLLKDDKFYHHRQSKENLSSKKNKLANKWKQYSLYDGTRPDFFLNDVKRCPSTWAIISSIDEIMNCKSGLVYFSLIPAGSIVIPHTSGLKEKDRIRHQLCLLLPTNSDPDLVYLEVNEEKRTWQLGEIISFDDSFKHKAQNLSDEDRLVLLYDSISL